MPISSNRLLAPIDRLVILDICSTTLGAVLLSFLRGSQGSQTHATPCHTIALVSCRCTREINNLTYYSTLVKTGIPTRHGLP